MPIEFLTSPPETSSTETSAPAAVAIGVFDGVHAGHRALLETASSFSNLRPVALTFHPHPASALDPERAPKLLTTLSERVRLIESHGVRPIVARFDPEFASLSPDEFIERVLVGELRAGAVVIGDDFRFGRGRAGDVEFLRSSSGFEVVALPTVAIDGAPVRSSRIRALVSSGEIDDAAALLGRPYFLRGTVVKGRQLGRTLGFPTANLALDSDRLIPAPGVYAGAASVEENGVNQEAVAAAISVGTNPTVTDGGPLTVEAYLMDGFDRDIYGATLTLTFVRHLRPTLKFDSLETLVAQMHRDVEAAQACLTSRDTAAVADIARRVGGVGVGF